MNRTICAIVWLYFATVSTAHAQSWSWDTPLCMIAKSLTGPVAMGLAVIATVVCGVMYAFSEGGGSSRAVSLLFGLALLVSANKMVETLFDVSLSTAGCR